MDRETAIAILQRAGSTKEALREALAWSLGVARIAQKDNVSLFSQLRVAFSEEYRRETGLDYSFSAKDAKALKLLEAKLTGITKSSDASQVVCSLRALLQQMPSWYKQNGYSMAIINSKFNEIVASIKKPSGAVTDAYKQRVVSSLLS